jgi:hypothetical protein
MKVELEKTIDFDTYDYFISKNKKSTFYHSSKHLRFLEEILDSKAMAILVKDNDELVGVLPFFMKENKYGKVLNSLPFFGSYGGIISERYEAQKKILEFLNNFNKENELLSSVVISNPFNRNDEIYDKNYTYHNKEERFIQCVDLKNKSQDLLWNEFEQRVRRSIRKSQKNLISVSVDDINEQKLERFYQLHKSDMESKSGRPKSPRFFKTLVKYFTQGQDYDILTGLKDSEEIAYLLVFYFSPFTEYYMPAYRSELKNLQSTSLLIWESMKISIERKMEFYNFGGTWKSQNELYMFKKGWNSTDYPYNYYIFRDLARINEIGLENIKENYENFYVIAYNEIEKTSS